MPQWVLALHESFKMAADVGDLIVKFSKKEYKICGLSGTDTVSDLKNAIHKQTGVLPQHQKLAGFKVKGRQLTKTCRIFFTRFTKSLLML